MVGGIAVDQGFATIPPHCTAMELPCWLLLSSTVGFADD